MFNSFNQDFWKFSLGFVVILIASFVVATYGVGYLEAREGAVEVACVGDEC